MEHAKRVDGDMVKVSFDLKETGWKWKEEKMWAIPVNSNGEFRLDNIPLLVYGISQGDIFLAELAEDGFFHFKSVMKRGGHSTVRVHFKTNPLDLNIIRTYLDALNKFGCNYEGNGSTLYALDIPAENDLSKIIGFLKEIEARGVWEYEEGYIHKADN